MTIDQYINTTKMDLIKDHTRLSLNLNVLGIELKELTTSIDALADDLADRQDFTTALALRKIRKAALEKVVEYLATTP